MDSIFAVNKPRGITSHDVVAMVRKKTGVKRVGHGGTLDPLASGVLVVAVGRENTKNLETFVKGEKEYTAEVYLGAYSTTDDDEGEKTQVTADILPKLSEIEDEITNFIGKIEQVPPVYSALKIDGKPAHRRARSGENIKMDARLVDIKDIRILDYDFPTLYLKVTTGPGVYIRSLARDLGTALGTGGYLKSLVRTRVNTFTLDEAHDIEEFKV